MFEYLWLSTVLISISKNSRLHNQYKSKLNLPLTKAAQSFSVVSNTTNTGFWLLYQTAVWYGFIAHFLRFDTVTWRSVKSGFANTFPCYLMTWRCVVMVTITWHTLRRCRINHPQGATIWKATNNSFFNPIYTCIYNACRLRNSRNQ